MRFISPDAQAFLNYVKAAGGPTLSELGPEGSRQMYKAMMAAVEPSRGPLARVAELQIPSPQGHSLAGRLFAAHEARETAPAHAARGSCGQAGPLRGGRSSVVPQRPGTDCDQTRRSGPSVRNRC